MDIYLNELIVKYNISRRTTCCNKTNDSNIFKFAAGPLFSNFKYDDVELILR